ncbi:hypothetical protein Dcar01_03839 [Deinococcus carri]|uniref:Uncharacterized protein n=1 Tax=Deinococcus carri TaxID=1211323 RepID=A0ABP9WF08_9DEIO
MSPLGSLTAYEAISSLGAIVPLSRLSSEEREDAEQAAYAARRFLPYDSTTSQVLSGPYRGLPIRDAEEREVEHLLQTYRYIRARTVTLRPWWRLFRATPTVVLMPANLLEVLL